MAQLQPGDAVMAPAHNPNVSSIQVIAQTQERLAVILALIAGYVDAYGILAFGAYLSFMSGNTTQTGVATGQGDLTAAAPAALAIVSFVTGCFTGTLLIHSGVHRPRRLLFGVVAALLALVIGLTQLDSLPRGVGIATLSLAMGGMNTALSHIGGQSVNLTFVTGTLNKMASNLALAVKHAPLPSAQGPSDTHAHRAYLLASVWLGFLTGAMLAGLATARVGVWVLLVPLVVLLALAMVSPILNANA